MSDVAPTVVRMDALTTADLLRPSQLGAPTPCTEHDVGSLRDHVLGWLTTFAAGYADPEGRAPVSAAESYETSVDPAGDVRSAANLLDAAVRAGAADRPLVLGTDGMPGDMALSMILWEYVVHGWDLARATGREWQPSAAASEAALAFAPAMLTPEYQGEGKPFGPRVEVLPTAPPLDRLLGLSGRDPSWSSS